MKREILAEKQRRVLAQMKELFESLEMETEYSPVSDNGIADIVIAEHREVGQNGDEVLGEYYFLPDQAPDLELSSFMISQTILDDMKETQAEDVIRAVSRLNLFVPIGNFLVDERNGIISYHHAVLLKAETPEDQMYEMARYSVAVSVEIVHRWMDPLMSLAYGNMELKDFLEILNTPAAEFAGKDDSENR